MRAPRMLAATLSTVALLALAACGGSDAGSEATESGSTPTTGESTTLETLTPGKLTIATGEPSYSPWVENDDPASGEGFEAAVAYAVADKLGFAKDDVEWVRTSFESAVAPGPKDFDFNIQQFTITEERKNAVDFSSPYYTTAPGLVSIKGNTGADATDLAGLKDALIGGSVGTSSLDAAEELIQPTEQVAVFNSTEDAVQALNAGQIDVLAVDLPTALYLAAAELDNGVVVGQLASDQGGDQFGLLLPKDSALTAPVSAAVDALQADGTLDELVATWLTDAAGAPVLK
ncbi:ABC transporter substrate-binding protein [Nocardioides sp.]|uniref:ABC transporter substrate-binding protein n=1 Tax=Nocardioides sp. TaxID=35761 RepID=UPI0039E3FA1D